MNNMNNINIEMPPGDHNWVKINNVQLDTIIWTCECGIRATYTFDWIWISSLKKKFEFSDTFPMSCAEYRMTKALE